MPSYSGWDEKQGLEIIERLKSVDGATLPILHALQDTFGFIHDRAIDMVANALNLSRAEIHGVVTFYHDFRREPAGRHILKLCRAEACQAVGADALAAQARETLGVGWRGTTSDGRVTLEPVFCLGLCACGPAAMLDGKLIGRMNKTSLLAAIARARA